MTINWQRTGRVIGIALAGLFIFVLSLLLIVAILLSTERGTRATLNVAERFVPGELVVEHAEGSLLGELTLDKVTYRGQGIAIEVDDFLLNWRPRQLLANRLHIHHVHFSSFTLNITPSEPPESERTEGDLQLPEINLPIDIMLEQASLNNLDIQVGDFSQHIERIELVAESRGYEQHIEHLLLRIEEGQLSAQGGVETRGDYPLNLNFETSLSLPDLEQLNAQAEVAGSLSNLDITLSSEGLIDAQLIASLQDALQIDTLLWQAELQVDAVRHPAVAEHIHGLSVAVQGDGSTQDLAVRIEGEAQSIEHGPIDINGQLRWEDMQLVIDELHAQARLEDQPALIDISGSATFGEQLNIDIQGHAEAFDFTINDFSLLATGDEQGAHDLTLALDVPQGQALVRGRLLWAPQLSWDLHIELHDLDLLEFNNTLEGEIALTLMTSGQLGEALTASANIAQLTGHIDGQLLSGSGQVHIQGDSLTAEGLDIQWGDAQLEVHGQYSPQRIDIAWLINIPELASLLPDAEGRIQSQGQVIGSQAQPILQASLNIDSFHWGEYELDESRVNIQADATFETLPVGDINVRNLRINDQHIERIDVRMRAQQQHTVEAEVDYGNLQANLGLSGDWNLEQLAWSGELYQLELHEPDLGSWQLNQSASLNASPERALIDGFCLHNTTREALLCADGKWSAENGDLNLAVRADDVPYQLFGTWIPDDVQLHGEFSLNADIEQASGQLLTDIQLNITDSSVRVPAQELRVDFDAGEILRIQGDQEELTLQLRILSEQLEGGIEANATLENILSEVRQIDGELGIDIRSFVLISVLIPEIQNVAGHLNGRIDFAGEINDLVIGGGLELREGSAEIPATGLELSNLNLTLTAPETNEAPFVLDGEVDAGEGQLTLHGEYYLHQQRARVSLQGDAFPALDTRDLQVTVAPDLELEYTPELLKLRGRVEIPRARITPPDFETVESVSSDTVIVGGEDGPHQQSVEAIPIDMDLVVNLGDDVRVSAYGFEGTLIGGLRIIEQNGQETTGVGNIDVASGDYEIYGQALNIERGRLIFTGGPIANPGLDLRVERDIDAQSVTVGARVGGTLENPTLNLFSTPSMQDSAILSYLIFGRGPGQGSDGEANMLARATLALGMSGGNRLGERLSDTFGVDEITLDSEDSFESTALYIGKQLSSRLYIKYGVGLVEPTSTFFIQYRLTDNLSFESRTGSEQSGADLFYTIER